MAPDGQRSGGLDLGEGAQVGEVEVGNVAGGHIYQGVSGHDIVELAKAMFAGSHERDAARAQLDHRLAAMELPLARIDAVIAALARLEEQIAQQRRALLALQTVVVAIALVVAATAAAIVIVYAERLLGGAPLRYLLGAALALALAWGGR